MSKAKLSAILLPLAITGLGLVIYAFIISYKACLILTLGVILQKIAKTIGDKYF